MKLTTKEKDDLAVRKYKEGRKDFVELQVETEEGGTSWQIDQARRF